MSIKEKIKLSKDFETLPYEKLTKALEILNVENNGNDGTFVFEIDNLDIETLWKLDRLVTNWKKSRNKKPRSFKKLESKLKEDAKNLKASDENEDVEVNIENSDNSSSSESSSSDSDSDSDSGSDSN